MTTTDHTHTWVRDEAHDGIRAWACTDCTETSASCGTCERPSGSSLLLCRVCEQRAADVLADIAHALDLHEPSPRSPVPSPGNMRLVQGPRAGSVVTAADVEGELWAWVACWTEHAGADNAAPLDYLRSRHVWAAHNVEASGWPAYLDAMRALRAAARRLAGLTPQRLPEPCVHCGGAVVQDWSDEDWNPHADGLSDTVRCTRCGMTWGDRSHWHLATLAHLADLPGLHPDSLITLAQARLIWPDVPAATWRKWAQRWRDEGEAQIERARHWWTWHCEHAAGRRPDHADADWSGPGDAPSLAGWLPQFGEHDGAPTYRVGDLQALVLRRAAPTATRRGTQGVQVGALA
jgi:hypothetical protein